MYIIFYYFIIMINLCLINDFNVNLYELRLLFIKFLDFLDSYFLIYNILKPALN
jgi:hypothetical protein